MTCPLSKSAFDITLPHHGSGLLFGEVPGHLRASERDARMALERTCSACGRFDACFNFGRPGVAQQTDVDSRWSCSDPTCLASVKAAWREQWGIAPTDPPAPDHPHALEPTGALL